MKKYKAIIYTWVGNVCFYSDVFDDVIRQARENAKRYNLIHNIVDVCIFKNSTYNKVFSYSLQAYEM